MSRIADNIGKVKDNIARAARRAGRDPGEITLIAVSKTHPAEAVYEAYLAGQRDFGENKVQELKAKAAEFPELFRGGAPAARVSPVWHMIGHLQINKVKHLPPLAAMIHSLDNLPLACEIESRAAGYGTSMDVLIEVNVSGEESKYGLKPTDLAGFIREAAGLKHLHLRGLMTVAPYTEDPEHNREYFRELKSLRDGLNAMHIPGVEMDALSMGMSGDYEVAVEEGATFVRVGTAIFGERDYGGRV